ncbi:bifunctional glutamate N-acetyltransferase/amino-acid acetyltransferase ArgJ [Tengunoibacter tsumagoiensis]|uniref:Arginine biosynthesis bifunctional protein ArgJ n=1 Tax=Tengunoibacter tsumagoiensis TaxID=2014871 RepID=A0A401ZXK7_9CHLR|nr:bifunctional glutamate N-acetyltransferase/amino-acid acetyltransferase ArgJ [Tengunoibacter tsumagoiensis]GCE11579.1 arginine biosynthesis bifunctional protein ArgJ 2 [Tengunoibacter tsumagoiensis]
MQTLPFHPRGFRSCAKNVGIRDESLDFTVIASDVPASAAAMFTQNRFCGAAIPVGREHVANGRLQAFVINSKNANVATGEQGIRNIREVVRLVGEELGIAPEDILPSSTGVIGWQLPMEKLRASIRGFSAEMQPGCLHVSARAIMTTDTRPKMRARKIGNAVLVGIAKGVGMIEPNMATMLSYFMTDARIEPDQLQACLKEAVDLSFNMLSVDTDTSTSDTVAIMANGLAGDVNMIEFRQALCKMAVELTKDLASDGEGATKLIEVTVDEASSFGQAKRIAKSIVNSPLVKTAVFGADPNWGRIAMAIGKCSEQEEIDPEKVTIAFGDIVVYRGEPVEHVSLDQLKSYLHHSEIEIHVSLGLGHEQATVWGCDLTYEYVRINGEYTS